MAVSVRVKSFDLVAQDISEADVQALHALSLGVGWPHRPADWELLRRVGQGIVAVDEIGRIFGSAMWFPHGEDFATVGLVITTPRAQANGAGRWLMEQVMDKCRGRSLALNSTRAAYPLYMSLGFDAEGKVSMHDGVVSAVPTLPKPDGILSELPAQSVHEVSALDKAAFGTERAQLLRVLSEAAVTCVLRRDGEVAGYAMRRNFGAGQVIGPVVASNEADAMQMVAWHLASLEGKYTRIDTREEGAFAEFLVACGLHPTEVTTTLSKGRRFLNRSQNAPWVYGLAGHALG
ncbi:MULTISPECIES: GNAT family N-acetyltransferase [unclassified Rhizobium]|uniref:GNAT family N-acetyltransferase n=1 Tax=unclassified Rhizobium TaxID=2613769 RepID=UPI002888FE21|nr:MULTISPECIES: GNAT family N-acetyltransferase [unclassified Rhizobium]